MKNSTPRRRKKTAAARLRPFWILIGFALLLLAGAAAALALWPGFAPKDVVVEGNRRVSRDEVLARAQIVPTVNMWLQNPRAIETRVEAIPYVDTAGVRRIPPATIAIDVTERVPFAVVTSGTQSALVDADMRVLEPVTAPQALVVFALPAGTALEPGTFLTSSDAQGLRRAYADLVAGHVTAVRVEYDKYGGVVATLRTGIRVMLGEPTEMPKKIALIQPILAQVIEKGRPADAIDLRAPNTPVVVYKN